MKKWLCVALGLAALSLWIGSADAGVAYQKLKSGRLLRSTVDSSAVVNVSGYDRMWLDFILTRPAGGTADSMMVLMLSVKEILPLYLTASSDTLTGAVRAPADTSNWLLPSVVTDSTTAYWMPMAGMPPTVASGAQPDTLGYNYLDRGALTPGSHEIRVRLAGPVSGQSHISRVRVELVNNFGVPFHALFAQFKWRFVGGTTATTHTVGNLRVVLGGEAW
jgi:hypothetical protein